MLTQSWPMVKDSGKVGGSRLITKRGVGRATSSANFVATAKMRHKLNDVKIREIGGKWFCVLRDGTLLKRFDTVGEAVSCISDMAQ